MQHLTTFALLAAVLGTSACSNRSLVVTKPADPRLNEDITVMWARDIERNARTGDWILTRSYSFTGDVITLTTSGERVSHASIYDARTGTVIEALRPTVREVPLANLLDRNQLAIVIRPSGMSQAQRVAAVERARGQIGVEFDLAGLIGFDDDSKFYCSELVYWASGLDPAKRPTIVTPASLMDFGEVVYYSGKRDERAVQDAAYQQPGLLAERRRARVLASIQ
ncbi:MAG TPA: YiiX/YebB-like N1pC/P60 family cysteine hydrolase [Kofleriaceae bacterium]|nr:YiiX/YebB-like N1pC/P60 family cysteine hydrolase [Kofleriaceae bacterium]